MATKTRGRRRTHTRCPHPSKRRFRDAREADAALHAIWNANGGKSFDAPLNKYECDCGGWHLTSRGW